MFVRITRTGDRSYVKIVEAFRDDTGSTRQRVIATLGRLEHVLRGDGLAHVGHARICILLRPLNLRDVPRELEEPHRLPGCASRPPRHGQRRLRARGGPQARRGSRDDLGELGFGVRFQPLPVAEPRPEGLREGPDPSRRPHHREGLEPESKDPAPRSLPDHHVDRPVLEGGVEGLLAGAVEAMDFVDEQQAALLEPGEERDELPGIADRARHDLLDLRPALRREQPGA